MFGCIYIYIKDDFFNFIKLNLNDISILYIFYGKRDFKYLCVIIVYFIIVYKSYIKNFNFIKIFKIY